MTQNSNEAPFRIGLAGCGMLGKVHARRFGGMKEVQVVAISDPSEPRLQECAAQLEGQQPRQLAHYTELLDQELDAVCIASPDSLHVSQVIAALDRGLHVLCEKPLTLEPEELKSVIEARDRAGKQVAMTYPRRYDAGLRAMRREVRSGRWGRVTSVTAYNGEDWVTPNIGQWRHDPQLCPGGFFHDASGHQLDTVFWVTGLQAEWVQAQASNRGTLVPICVWGTARLAADVPFIFSFIGDGHNWREQVNIHCENRDFVVENSRAFWSGDRRLEQMEPEGESERAEESFLRLIREGSPNWSPLEDLWPLVHFTRTALESAERGVGMEVREG